MQLKPSRTRFTLQNLINFTFLVLRSLVLILATILYSFKRRSHTTNFFTQKFAGNFYILLAIANFLHNNLYFIGNFSAMNEYLL